MFIKSFIMLAAISAVQGVALAQTPTPTERINDFFLEMSIVAERYSCTGFITSFTAEKVDDRSEFTQCDFRRVVDQATKRTRADIRTESPATLPGHFVYEHFLRNPKGIFFGMHVMQGRDIKHFPEGVPYQPPAPASINWTLLPVYGEITLGTGRGHSEEALSTGNIICEKLLPKNRKAIYIAHEDNQAAMKLVFAPEPAWLLEEVAFLGSPTDERGMIIKEKTSERVSEKEMLSWRTRGKTQTTWVQIGERWVPSRCLMTSSGLSYSAGQGTEFESTSEILFADWKLGKDVDLELLEDASFTTEEIQKTINFDRWRSAAIQANRKPTK